jgi:hypothetical protein
MSELDSAKKHNTERAQFAVEPPVIISQDRARQGPNDHQVLYVLGFGVVGAILANMLVFIYFVSFRTLG